MRCAQTIETQVTASTGALMTKHELLQHLADAGQAYAMDIANTFGITYPAAAMALLRLARQGVPTWDLLVQ